ncbi:MAG TPA: TetR/AcrR family transcriptional regulator [Acidimicrobiales bacterium]|nr:TetR/AcrR family transcriptional regulator [Acidimicrobiales bacterium]
MPKTQATPVAPIAGVPRSRRGELTRAKLVNAAKVIFERDGFLNARIVDIAAKAKMSYGAFYHYFDSKEQIFREVAEAQEDRLTAPPEAGEPRRGEPTPYGRIHEANRRYLERYRSEAALMGVIEQVSRYDPYVNAARMASQKHFAERSERAIRKLQREGAADPRVKPAIAADALGSMIARFAELWLTQGYREYDFDEAVDQLSLLWANALGIDSQELEPKSRIRKPRKPTSSRGGNV